MTKAIILDTETTDKNNPQPISIAYGKYELGKHLEDIFFQNYKPTNSITYGALSTHHILEEELKDCPPYTDFKLPEVEYIIGHNIDFDWGAIGKPDVKRICTLALARYLLPDLDSHTQSALAYYYFYGPEIRQELRNAHDAKADIIMCNRILNKLLKEINAVDVITIEELYKISEIARIPTKFTFGKYGEPGNQKTFKEVAKIDRQYMTWLYNKTEDVYLKQGLLNALQGK